MLSVFGRVAWHLALRDDLFFSKLYSAIILLKIFRHFFAPINHGLHGLKPCGTVHCNLRSARRVASKQRETIVCFPSSTTLLMKKQFPWPFSQRFDSNLGEISNVRSVFGQVA
jgi:hypothetical protein